MTRSDRSRSCRDRARLIVLAFSMILVIGCGYRFGVGPPGSPFPSDLKTVVLESAVNNTTVTGIETELTNDLRREFALGQGLQPVRDNGDTVLKTIISSYVDTPASYKADGKELTRIGILSVSCLLSRVEKNKVLWSKDLSSSYAYTVTDTISATLTNRRKAISSMIKQLVPRIHRSLHDNF